MKLPEKPENWRKTINKNPDSVLNLLKDKEVLKFISKYNSSYSHWDKIRRVKIPKEIDAKKIWALMKLFRNEKHYHLPFNGFDFRYTLLPRTLKKLHILDKESAGNIEIEDSSLTSKGRSKYIVSSLMEEAIASSQLEGAVTTRKIAKEMLRQNRKPKTYSEQMILNGYKTLMMVLNKKEQKLTKEFLLEVQKSITKNTLKDKRDEGKFRDNNEIVVGDNIEADKIYYTPPDYKKIPKLIDELCKFANEDEGEFIHPIIKGIILHFLIGFIHPFNDGNGRTARAILYWCVISKGYWLFEYMAMSRKILSSKVKYGLAYLYSETDENDLTYFIDYNIEAINNALVDMRNYIKRQQKELIDANKMIGELKGINFRQASILKDFMKTPNKYFTIREIQNSYNIVYQTARSDLLYLVKLKYISMKKSKNKFVFIFTKRNQETINDLIKHY